MPSINDFLNLGGWVDDQEVVQSSMEGLAHPLFLPAASAIKESGEGKVVLLHQFVEKLNGGRFNVRTQEGPDCTSFATACAIDCVKAAEIVSKKQNEIWDYETATEPIYIGSRINIGKGQLGNGGGSYGVWVARYANEIGAPSRNNYSELQDGLDLRTYNWRIANLLSGGRGAGLNEKFVQFCNTKKIRTTSQVRTYTEVRDAIANGYAVIICSNQGFTSTRDREGFASPSGSWAHAMCVTGVDDKGEGCSRKRPGVLVQNSWGPDWITGPKRHNQPDGSFWVDAQVLESRILSAGDSWVLSDYDGYPTKKLNLRII